MQRTDIKSLRKYGVTMGVVLAVIGAVVLLKHRHNPAYFFIPSAAFLLAGLAAPVILKPVYIVWMRLALILGWINTRVLLALIFYLIFTPVGLLMHLFKADPLDLKFEHGKKGYWRVKENSPVDPRCYERQF